MLATARLGTGWISSCIAATCFEEAPFELWAKSQFHKEATGGQQQQQCKVLLNFKISESTNFFVGLFVTILSLLELSYISTLNTKVPQLASLDVDSNSKGYGPKTPLHPLRLQWHWKGTKSSKVKKITAPTLNEITAAQGACHRYVHHSHDCLKTESRHKARANLYCLVKQRLKPGLVELSFSWRRQILLHQWWTQKPPNQKNTVYEKKSEVDVPFCYMFVHIHLYYISYKLYKGANKSSSAAVPRELSQGIWRLSSV